ncbi:acetylcholinesterase-like [Mytilus trossulus]|uniref:acetylcholinesterase-like n=1 Tax=Mytilus trossulus TaxID=6551 RepID=UPI0030047FB0
MKITFIVSLLVSAVQADSPFTRHQLLTHTTILGEVTGLKIWKYNTTVYQFKKIPYAKPPLTSLRFERPQPIRSWNETLNGTEYGPNCMQYLFENDKRLIPNLKISEDCLHLNIFAPRDLNKTSNRPVMIWIHGGGFTNGQGMMFDGSKLAALYDVVIVTINYRLNIFGFINVGAGPGRNIGLWDQRFGIKWVKDNIMDYGGNPEMITIFGESAGGISVGLQSVIPKNKGLFQRTIAHSGSLLLIRDIDDTEKLTREIGRIFNCSECLNGIQTCLDCLRKVSAESLLQKYAAAENILQNGFSMNSTIGPIVDGELIPENPVDMLSDSTSPASQMFSSIDYITGTNDCEAGLFYFNLIGQQASFNFDLKKGIPSRIVCNLFAAHVSRDIFKGCDKVSEEICQKYSPQDKNPSLSQETYQAMNAYSDLEFASLAVRDLDFHSRSNKGTYQYLFTHKPTWGLIEDRPSWLVGANHADELEFVFGLEDWFPVNIDISPYEVELSSKMMSFWTTFAKTGNPNPRNTQEWPAYDKTTKRFIILGEYRNSTVDGFHDRMRFWNENVPKLVSECHQKTDTSTPNQAINFTLSAGCSYAMSIRIVVLLLLYHIFIIY